MAQDELPPTETRGHAIQDPGDGPIYRPAPGELQLTLRAVLIGCALGGLVAAMNIAFGLKTGWGIGGSLIAAILAYATFATMRPKRPFTPLETNIAQTAASAAGSMTFAAGLVAPIPALQMMGMDLGYVELTLWATAVAWLGVFYAVPLRRQMVLEEKLRFPTGTATATTIVAMFGSGAETVRKARALLGWALVAAVFTLLAYFVPHAAEPPLQEWLPVTVLTVPAFYTFTLLVSPLLIGAGILVGMRVSLSLVIGAIVAWAILAPIVEHQGWVEKGTGATAAGGWLLWIGVAVMMGDALTSLALSWRSIVGTFRPRAARAAAGLEDLEDPNEAIPNSWWMGGLAAATVLTVVVVALLFHIPWYLTVLAVILSSVLAAIATRSTGETDINPISGVGKVTQLAYGGIAPGQVETNLLAAAITGSGASQAADMMQDLKTGHLMGASPRKQLVAQLAGVFAGILFCVPIYLLVTQAYPIGSDKFPAPSAKAWKGVAEVLADGLGSLPPNAAYAAAIGLLFGIMVPLLRKFSPKVRPYLPSGLAFGIAFIIPAYYSLCFLVGAIALLVWKRVNAASAAALSFAVASGLIAGNGLMEILTSVLKLLEVPELWQILQG